MASYGFDGETTKVAKLGGPRGKGKRRAPKTKYKRSGPGKSPLVPVSNAERVAGAIKKRGNSAAAPGQRKKALGLKSARTLAPGAARRAAAGAANPMPGAGGAAKAQAIASRGPKRQPPAKVGPHRGATMPQVSAPEVPRPGIAAKFGSAKKRRQAPAKRARRGMPGL